MTQALEVTPEDDVISIASGGDNSFALLLNNPRSLTVVDSNPLQIYLVELKMRAIQILDYDDFVGFVGARPCQKRLQLYSHLRPSLSDQARGYWDNKPNKLLKGIVHSGKFEQYFSVFRQIVLPLIHSKKTIEELLSITLLEKQQIFYDTIWNNRRWRWLFHIFFGKFLLEHLGRDPSYFKYVTLDNIAEELLRRTRHGLIEVSTQDNFFVEYILTGQYSNLEMTHPYLGESNFNFLKGNMERILLVCGSLDYYLKSSNPRSFSKLNLSDVFEYMSDDNFKQTLQNILRVCRVGAKLAHWTLLVHRDIPEELAGQIKPCTSISEKLFSTNRTFFYGTFGLWHTVKG